MHNSARLIGNFIAAPALPFSELHDPIPPYDLKKWLMFLNHLRDASQVKLPRFVLIPEEIIIHLQEFIDESKNACTAAANLCSING